MSAQAGEAATTPGPLTVGAERTPRSSTSLSPGPGSRTGYRLPAQVRAELDRRALLALAADVLGGRECAVCDFTGHESEFIAFGHYNDGSMVLVHRDDAPEGFVLICLGCASLVGRLCPGTMAGCVDALSARIERAAG